MTYYHEKATKQKGGDMATSTTVLGGFLMLILIGSQYVYWRIGVIISLAVAMTCIFALSFWMFYGLENETDERVD